MAIIKAVFSVNCTYHGVTVNVDIPCHAFLVQYSTQLCKMSKEIIWPQLCLFFAILDYNSFNLSTLSAPG